MSVVDVPDQFLPRNIWRWPQGSHGVTEYLLPPLPNCLHPRRPAGSTAGVTLNPLYWPARKEETFLTTAIYKFHPSFVNAPIRVLGEAIPTRISAWRRWKAAMSCRLATVRC